MSYGESLADQFIWMSKAIARVRKLHKPVELLTDYGRTKICQECYEVAGDRERAFYPCYTIKALDGEQE